MKENKELKLVLYTSDCYKIIPFVYIKTNDILKVQTYDGNSESVKVLLKNGGEAEINVLNWDEYIDKDYKGDGGHYYHSRLFEFLKENPELEEKCYLCEDGCYRPKAEIE